MQQNTQGEQKLRDRQRTRVSQDWGIAGRLRGPYDSRSRPMDNRADDRYLIATL